MTSQSAITQWRYKINRGGKLLCRHGLYDFVWSCLWAGAHCKGSDCIEGLPVSQLSTVNFVIIAVNNVCQEINACEWVNDKIATSV